MNFAKVPLPPQLFDITHFIGLFDKVTAYKCPVPIAYMEIGFYDSSDLSILQLSSDEIGKAIAEGVDEYLKNN